MISVGMILAGMYLYFVLQIGRIEAGCIKRVSCLGLLFSCITIGLIVNQAYLGCLVATGMMLLFDLFYDQEPFGEKWRWISLLGISMSVSFLVHKTLKLESKSVILIGLLLVLSLLLNLYRKQCQIGVNGMVIGIYGCYGYMAYTLRGTGYEVMSLGLALMTLAVSEQISTGYRTSFERKTLHFEQALLLSQYEEIKHIYLNMRGFRHDYHNHIQVIKAHLQLEQVDLAQDYLEQLEQELERIDGSVRSGNLMIDAILNSKLAVAQKYGIQVTCKAQVPEQLHITDVDVCALFGNLLDNAIEACQKIEENRFIRIYIAVIKKQLYLSIQNAAKEELDFNEKHYISTKRGNHGLGMKRVKLLVEKYEGYLNVQNEPGIFAAEVTLPL